MGDSAHARLQALVGDWEAVRGLRTLEAQQPLDLGEAPPAQPAPANAEEAKAYTRERKKAIENSIRAIGRESNDIDGLEVSFPVDMGGKIARHLGFDMLHIAGELGRLYKSAVPMFAEPELLQEGHKDHTRNFSGYRQYVNRFTQSGEEYYIRFTVQQNAGSGKASGQAQMHSSFVSEVGIYNGKGVRLTHVSFRDNPVLTEAERLMPSNVSGQAGEIKFQDDKLADWLAAARRGVSAAVDESTGEPLAATVDAFRSQVTAEQNMQFAREMGVSVTGFEEDVARLREARQSDEFEPDVRLADYSVPAGYTGHALQVRAYVLDERDRDWVQTMSGEQGRWKQARKNEQPDQWRVYAGNRMLVVFNADGRVYDATSIRSL